MTQHFSGMMDLRGTGVWSSGVCGLIWKKGILNFPTEFEREILVYMIHFKGRKVWETVVQDKVKETLLLRPSKSSSVHPDKVPCLEIAFQALNSRKLFGSKITMS